MKAIEIKDSYVVIQKDFIKKACSLLIPAVLASVITFLMISEGAGLYYNVNDIFLWDMANNVLLVVMSDITLLCAGGIIRCFASLKKWQINTLYLILSVLWGIRYFWIYCGSMMPPGWIKEWSLNENLILACSVHIVLIAVIFASTLLFDFLCGKIKRKTEIKAAYVTVQKDLIKKVRNSLILAASAALSAYLVIECAVFFLYGGIETDFLRAAVNDVLFVAACDVTLLCAGRIIRYFTNPKKWQINVLYLILSALWGYYSFGCNRWSMIPRSWVYEWGFTENLILMYSVHIALTIVIFTTTLLAESIFGKIRRNLAVIPTETGKPV